MALTINNENGVFMIVGAINATTAQHLENHFNSLLDNNHEVTINIDKVNFIDTFGLSALRRLYQNSTENQKKAFYIVGNGCKEIYDDFRYHKAS